MRVIEANEAALQLLQISSQQAFGRPLEELLDESYAVCCRVLQNTVTTQQPVREYQVELQPETRPRQVVVLNSSPLVGSDNTFVGAVLAVRDITRMTSLELELKERYRFQNIIGKSPKMQEIYDLLESLTGTTTTVLITGETGTGKELVADALPER
jgi:transcriptional regulator with PAS, ATPase and Fis domain